MLFLVPKNVLFVIFFFSCVNIVFCELMLLELGDLLGLSLLRNFFSAANISARLLYISSSSNLIPHFVLHISRLPDIAQKTACTQNEAMDVTFQMKYVSAFQDACSQRYYAKTFGVIIIHIFADSPFISLKLLNSNILVSPIEEYSSYGNFLDSN